jgi:hypothetical protein
MGVGTRLLCNDLLVVGKVQTKVREKRQLSWLTDCFVKELMRYARTNKRVANYISVYISVPDVHSSRARGRSVRRRRPATVERHSGACPAAHLTKIKIRLFCMISNAEHDKPKVDSVTPLRIYAYMGSA